MPSKKGPIIAEELLRRLEADPDWVARRNAGEQDRLKREQHAKEQQIALLRDLQAAGTVVDSVWDLVNTAQPYPKALPVLLDHLLRPYDERILEGIARALAVKEARPIAWDQLVGIVRSSAFSEGVADAVMAAISAMALPSDLPLLIDLINDKSLGRRRIFLVSNLMRSRKVQARQVLLDLRNDPELTMEIAFRLGRSTLP